MYSGIDILGNLACVVESLCEKKLRQLLGTRDFIDSGYHSDSSY